MRWTSKGPTLFGVERVREVLGLRDRRLVGADVANLAVAERLVASEVSDLGEEPTFIGV